MTTEWRRLAETIQEQFGALGDRDGVPDGQLREAEVRLELSLPERLRRFYSRAGRCDRLVHAYEQLIAPHQLSVEQGVLPFWTVNQPSSLNRGWGVRLSDCHREDPPVVKLDGTGWEPDHEALSDFLLTMVHWQRVNAAPCAVVGDVAADTVEEIASSFPRIPLPGCSWEVRCFGEGGLVLMLLGDDETPDLHIGAPTDDLLDEIDEALELEWDFYSPDDQRRRRSEAPR